MANPTNVIKSKRSLDNGILKYPIDLSSDGRKNYIRFDLKYNNQNQYLGQQENTLVKNIALYLPRGSLKTSYGQNFSEFAGGLFAEEIIGGTLDELAGQVKDTVEGKQNTTDMFKSLYESTTAALTNSKKIENIIAGLTGPIISTATGALAGVPLLGFLSQGVINDAISSTTGLAINPHTSVIYKGPKSFRTFNFTFAFYPRSVEEAKQVNDIVFAFKQLMLPKKTENLTFASTFLKHPGTIDTKLYVNGKEFDKFSIRKSVLTDLNLNYESEGGPSFFEDGEPMRTLMSFSIKEVEFIYNDDENIPTDTPSTQEITSGGNYNPITGEGY